MKTYTCIIMDDEILAQELMSNHASRIPNLKVLAICNNVVEAKMAIDKYTPDIMFLDIQMPQITGMELLKMLKYKPVTILTTAYKEYAIEGYEYDVSGYLLKPIEFERFFTALIKAFERIDRQTNSPTDTIDVQKEEVKTDNFFFVKADFKTIKVVYNDIIYIEALQKYVRIHMADQRIVTLLSMSQLEDLLPSNQFMRIHRSFIVNLDKIQSVDGNQIIIDKHTIPISKSQKEEFANRAKPKFRI